jgi:hypothetical protein
VLTWTNHINITSKMIRNANPYTMFQLTESETRSLEDSATCSSLRIIGVEEAIICQGKDQRLQCSPCEEEVQRAGIWRQ